MTAPEARASHFRISAGLKLSKVSRGRLDCISPYRDVEEVLMSSSKTELGAVGVRLSSSGRSCALACQASDLSYRR